MGTNLRPGGLWEDAHPDWRIAWRVVRRREGSSRILREYVRAVSHTWHLLLPCFLRGTAYRYQVGSDKIAMVSELYYLKVGLETITVGHLPL